MKLDSRLNTADRTVTVRLEHFSLYGVSGDPEGDGTSGWGKVDTEEKE